MRRWSDTRAARAPGEPGEPGEPESRDVPDGSETPASPGRKREAPERLLARLPELYREDPGHLRALLDVADDLVDATRGAFAVIAEGSRPPPLERERGRGQRGALVDLLERLPSDWPPPRAVWQDARVYRLEGDALAVRVGKLASVVLLWEEEDLEERSRETTLRTEDCPVEAGLQLVVVRRLPARFPVEGARLHGTVLWQKVAP